MANIIEVIAKFINEASPGLKQLGVDVGGVGKSTDETNKSTESLGGKLNGLLGQFGMTLSVVGAVSSAFAFLKSTVDAYGESELVAAQVNAVLQSTNQIAGVTAEEIDTIADSLSRMSGQDDEAIKRGEALMLTFTKVGKDVFPQATEAALNMSMAMETDLQGSIIAVGKALNEPVAGVTALRRMGVQLSDQQEEQVKQFMAVNDIASAQAIVLGELQTEFGGVAEMMGDTTVGATNKLKVAWGNLMETLGENPAGIWRSITEGVTSTVEVMDQAAQANNDYWDSVRIGNEMVAIYGGNIALTRAEFNMYGERIKEAGYEYARAEQYGAAWSKMLTDQTVITSTANDALSEYVPNFTKLLDLSSNVANETERYNDKQTDLITKQSEVKAKIDELIVQGWSPLSQKVQDLQKDYDDLGMKYDENAQKHAEAMGKIQYDLLLTKLSVGGLDQAEFEMMQQAGLMFGVFDQQSADAARNMDLVTQAVQDGKLKVEDMGAALEMLPKMKSIDVVINALVNMANSSPELTGGATSSSRRHGGAVGFAEGGSFTVPTGFPSDSYMIGLTSGEQVTVVPPGDLQRNTSMVGGGNTYQVVVQINSPINLMSENEAQTVLMPMIVQAVKQAEAEARL